MLGVDPGTNVLGYAVIETEGKYFRLLDFGVIHLRSLDDQQWKLKKIFEDLQIIITKYKPHEMAIEAPFFGKNVQSMLKLGRAQGVAIAAGITNGLSITEYSPKKIKQAITGKGNASKEQVAAMLRNILNRELDQQYLDATDALATAVCHFYQSSNHLTGKSGKFKGWQGYLKDNPERQFKPY